MKENKTSKIAQSSFKRSPYLRENTLKQDFLFKEREFKQRPPKQTSLFKKPKTNTKKWWVEEQNVYGGDLNYRKTSRPFDSKKLIHVVFKANLGKAIYFTRSQKSILELIMSSLYRYNLKLKSFSIQRDHIHLLCYSNSQVSPMKAQEEFKNFLRFFSSEMGRKYKAIFKRFGISESKSLWVKRPFTRLVSWGKKSFLKVIEYIEKNTQEALGLVEYTPRDHALNKFLKKWTTQKQPVEDSSLKESQPWANQQPVPA